MESLIEEVLDPECGLRVVGENSVIIKYVEKKICPNGDVFTGHVNAVTGQLIDGKRIYRDKQECYEGPFVNGERNGMGICTRLDGEGKFLGEFLNESYHQGTQVTKDYTYNGFFSECLFHGKGTLAHSNGTLYEGEFDTGLFHGTGKLTTFERDTYEGGFHHGKKQGHGTLSYIAGGKYVGDWKQDKKDGVGCETYKRTCYEYEGEYVNGKRHGTGTMKTPAAIFTGPWRYDRPLNGSDWTIEYPNTGVRYSGEAFMCRPHGFGEFSYTNRDTNEIFKYEGRVSCGLRHGTGTMLTSKAKSPISWKGDLPLLDGQEIGVDAGVTDLGIPNLDEIESSNSDPTDSPGYKISPLSNEGDEDDRDVRVYENGDTFHGHIDVFHQRQGFGIYTEASTGMTYSGQWKSSKKHGRGTLTQPLSGVQYIGIFIEDVIEGNGSLRLPDGSKYSGKFVDGMMQGQGTFHDVTNEIEYTGEFYQSMKHGSGEETYFDKTVYVGTFVNGLRSGENGCLYRESSNDSGRQLLYQGDWLDDRITGEGKRYELEEPCAGSYEGHFKDCKRHGHGIFTADNGCIFEGEWSDNVPCDGDWVITCRKGSVYYGAAVCKDGIPIADGFGTHNENDGTFYSGGFRAGKRDGSGLCVFSTGEQWDGRWENGIFAKYGRPRP